MVKVRVLRAFVNENREYGNPVGVIEPSEGVTDPAERQRIATQLGYSESVFIDDVDRSTIGIYSGKREVPFAGHAVVGVAWLLEQLRDSAPTVVRTAQEEVDVWQEDGAVWVRSSLATAPPWWHERLSSPSEVEELSGPLNANQDMTQLWAWENEGAGILRVRTFASRAGIAEDEACGSGAQRMAAALGRRLVLHHGRGSVIHAKPGPPGFADIGGRVVEDEPRTV